MSISEEGCSGAREHGPAAALPAAAAAPLLRRPPCERRLIVCEEEEDAEEIEIVAVAEVRIERAEKGRDRSAAI